MLRPIFFALICSLCTTSAWASEADLILPDFAAVDVGSGINGRQLLQMGLLICALGMVFGTVVFARLRALPVHRSMREISELIYETCKTYLLTQGRFILLLEGLIATIIVMYFGGLRHFAAAKVAAIVGCSLLGIAGSWGVAWFGIRVNTFANSRTAFASLRGRPYPTFSIPLQAGISIGTLLICVELVVMLSILLYVPVDFAGPCFVGFAIGESLAAAALRIAGGIFTKIADIGADLMKIVFNIDEDDARNPGVIADCAGDNAGDSVGPTADGFETYGVTGVALITFILLAVPDSPTQARLLVWLFALQIMMIVSSILSYGVNQLLAHRRYASALKMDFEAPLTSLMWITSGISVVGTLATSYLLLAELADPTLWWKLAAVVSFGTLAGALIPELVKAFTSTRSAHVREVVTASRQGGASLNVLAGLTAGNFSAYWLGLTIVGLMGLAFGISLTGLGAVMVAPAVFAFGLLAFGFLSMGPVTIAVDSYGPVTDNAQSVYELSMIEKEPQIAEEIARDFGFTPNFERAKRYLEENDSAGNTFKATAKPVLIGTAVVGSTTLIFSIIMMLTHGLKDHVELLSIVHPPFLLGLISGGAIIYWFTGASIQAVSTGAYQAVAFIRANIRVDAEATRASIEDSKKVVEICTQYAQKGMVNIFLGVFFTTLAFACLDPYFFIGYLISIAISGLYQAIFMANAGGAWDNAKKLVEVDLQEKNTPLHEAVVVGDMVGDPFKDTSSVALNPVIKFTTLFGLLAVELAVEMAPGLRMICGLGLFAASMIFVLRSFYSMRIGEVGVPEAAAAAGSSVTKLAS